MHESREKINQPTVCLSVRVLLTIPNFWKLQRLFESLIKNLLCFLLLFLFSIFPPMWLGQQWVPDHSHISNMSNVEIVALNTWCQWIALLSISSANDWRADTLKHSCVAHSTIRMHELKTKQFVCYVDMKSTQSLIDLEINSKNSRTSLPSLRKYFHTEIHFDDICKLCGFVIRSF